MHTENIKTKKFGTNNSCMCVYGEEPFVGARLIEFRGDNLFHSQNHSILAHKADGSPGGNICSQIKV